MGLRKMVTGVAALALVATPVFAASANPAASLSVAPAAARASAPKGESKFESHGFAILALAALALVGVLAASSGGDGSSSP